MTLANSSPLIDQWTPAWSALYWLIGASAIVLEFSGLYLVPAYLLTVCLFFGPTIFFRTKANTVTLGRTLLFLLAPMAINSGDWVGPAFLLLLLMFDKLDGVVARQEGPTQVGALLDSEADNVFIFLLCFCYFLQTQTISYLLAIPFVRPTFVLTMLALKWIRPEFHFNPPPTLRGKWICGTIMVTLVFFISPFASWIAPYILSAELALLCLLLFSFACDIINFKLQRPVL